MSLLVVGMVTLCLSMAWAVAWVWRLEYRASEAQGTADSAALAEVLEGRGRDLARANGAGRIRVVSNGATAEALVEVGGVTREATAAVVDGSASDALDAVLTRTNQVLGRRLVVARIAPDRRSVLVSPADAAELARLFDHTGLCPVGASWFEICSST